MAPTADVLVIGAGPTGLCAAKTLLQRDPSADVLLVDAHASVGGVWAKEMLYPNLKTNNFVTSIDFCDFPMDYAKYGLKEKQHVPGPVMYEYLNEYAKHFGVLDKIRLNTRVDRVTRPRDGGEWHVDVVEEDVARTLTCNRLIVATGVLTVPHMPTISGSETFSPPFLHSSDLGPRQDLFANPDITNVAVLGGSKSAYDAVHLAASTGHKVRWIIRRSGRGPVWVAPAFTQLGPFKVWRERLVTRRVCAFMSPCIFPDMSGMPWIRRFLHESALGRVVTKAFWALIRHDTINDCGYQTDERFKVLQPEQNMFWYGTNSGILSFDDDFFEYIRNGQVQIHREDVSHLSEDAVHLADGTSLPVDLLVASTGYSAKPTITFEPASLHSDLGIPTTELGPKQSAFWNELDAQADHVIGTQFPRLLDGPFQNPTSSKPKPFNPGSSAEAAYTPWRLYRGIAPPGLAARNDRSLLFIGMFSNLANIMRLDAQCLWALAYMEGRIPAVDGDIRAGRIFDETALMQRWAQHRAPYGHGRLYPCLVFDQMPYWDMLLGDVGVETKRKSGWWAEFWESYAPADYRGIVAEWIAQNPR
ncbi:FAD-dependent monooxygenase DEP4 [Colletotrichum orbiculare MAFF 240422]|uniref:FAD-dependent monooxygenase DEP4 n=1 Tax=Colletotrichum orbiculare (strain 104-T / ATCC 96160 / CBS 514.97 / LARS 414 / MAFF 240422) TaxID=1213857 RepID=N4V5I4_COLOR|nr:FAD-dependent monooxygenase DEP4 [Colletotrichum orbiculare MAFF 240422]